MYESFIIAIETRDNLPKFEILKQKLLEEAERKKQQDETTGDIETQAFVVYNKGRNNYKYEEKRKPESNHQNRERIKNDRKCFNCGIKGHYAAQCRKNKKPNSYTAYYGEVNLIENLNMDNWCIDSGATTHMCNDRMMFISFKNYNENIVTAGNKIIPICKWNCNSLNKN